MASPYRGGGSRPESPVLDDGIVGDLVRQFADRFAFLRELVQNSIDAGSERIDVRVHNTDDGMRISTRDNGEGMDPDTLKEKLLVLFRSGKEGQEGKIGKFGIGFVSVLAVKPDRVTVQTSRGGPAWTLHLHQDHSYELFESGKSDDSGTTVTLHVPISVDEQEAFVKSAHASLLRWCRHAAIPIRFTWPSGKTETIVRPLALDDSVLEVERTEGDTKIVVGLPRKPGDTYAGFFNHGLTLFETSEIHSFGRHARIFQGRAFKVMDPELEHTLSRDNVRRDAAFRRVLTMVARCINQELGVAFRRAVAKAADDRDGQAHRELLSHWDETLPVAKAAITVPRLHGGPKSFGGLPGKVFFSSSDSPLTRALADHGHSIVTGLSHNTRQRLGLQVAKHVVTLVEPVPAEGTDALLIEALHDLLDAYRKPSSVQLVRFYGATNGLYAGGPRETEPWLSFDPLDADPFRRLMRPALLLNVSNNAVIIARKKAKTRPYVAAALVARAVLTQHKALNAAVDNALTVRAMNRVLET